MNLVFVGSFLGIVVASSAFAQSKIEAVLTREVQSSKFVRVLIVTRPDPTLYGGGSSISNVGSYLSGTLGSSASSIAPIGSLPVAAAEVDANALGKLNSDPNVVLVTKDTPVPPVLFESVPQIGGDAAHALGFDGRGYSVAVLDTGVDSNHPALAGSVTAEACFSTPSSAQYRLRSLCPGEHDVSLVPGAAQGCPQGIEGCEHGTHVAGIIAGHNMQLGTKHFEGVAPAAKVVAVQVFTQFLDASACGEERTPCVLSFTSDQLRGLDWVYKQVDKYKVASVNMSLGGGYHDSACDQTSALTEIIERLKAKGVATIVAAGNNHFYDGVSEPACISSTIAVAAENKSGQIDVSYSNRSRLVHFIAPGTNITSSVPGGGYKSLSGTSMAAPHVAAAFAVMRARYPDLSVREVEAKLVSLSHSLEDTTTGEHFPALSLTDTTAGQTAGGSAAHTSEAASNISVEQPASAVTPPASGSFVVQSSRTEGELSSEIQNFCKDHKCDLKALTRNTWKLDVAPKDDAAVDVPSAAELERSLGGREKVFDNKIFSPLR